MVLALCNLPVAGRVYSIVGSDGEMDCITTGNYATRIKVVRSPAVTFDNNNTHFDEEMPEHLLYSGA